MKKHIVKIQSIQHITHDVLKIVTEKPEHYKFTPGQATEIAINKEAWKNEKRPFTFTCLPDRDYLEFTIKIYTDHNGITNELGKIKPGDELIIRDVWGDIAYNGIGMFIAGGAGITPFISILRDLEQKNLVDGNILIFANKTQNDIILESELSHLLGKSFVNILSGEKIAGYSYGFITDKFLKKYISPKTEKYYLCGPPPMMEAIIKHLSDLGISESQITMEKM